MKNYLQIIAFGVFWFVAKRFYRTAYLSLIVLLIYRFVTFSLALSVFYINQTNFIFNSLLATIPNTAGIFKLFYFILEALWIKSHMLAYEVIVWISFNLSLSIIFLRKNNKLPSFKSAIFYSHTKSKFDFTTTFFVFIILILVQIIIMVLCMDISILLEELQSKASATNHILEDTQDLYNYITFELTILGIIAGCLFITLLYKDYKMRNIYLKETQK